MIDSHVLPGTQFFSYISSGICYPSELSSLTALMGRLWFNKYLFSLQIPSFFALWSRVFFISTLLEDYLQFPSVLLSINYPPISAFAKMDEANKIDDFRREWLRQHRARSDWQAIIKPCYDNMAWGKVKRGWEKANRTNSLLLLSNDEVKAAHSDFDRCPRGGGLRPKFLSISIFLGHTLRSKITAP